MVTKLYNLKNPVKEYWETWDNGDGTRTIHWGKLGDKGQSKEIKSSLFRKASKTVEQEIAKQRQLGFTENNNLQILLIEYNVEGFGTEAELEKRHRLQDRMDETLGWTGLGHCDGGSAGSGTMEVCNFVVDVEIAKSVIETDLKDTEFADFSRIYVEE